MASACINNIGLSPENFLDCPPAAAYVWSTPRLSLGMPQEEASRNKRIPTSSTLSDLPEESDLEVSALEFGDFEFRLDDPVMMLPADELFSDGKLVPLQLPVIRHEATESGTAIPTSISSPDSPNCHRKTDPELSPKAPRCSRKWRDFLRFRRLYQSNIAKQDNNKTESESESSSHGAYGATRSIRQFLHRSSKSSNDSSINLPLLKDTDDESVTVSSRPSLSSSSSGHDLDDIPRLSLDSEKPAKVNLNTNPSKMRMVKTRTRSTDLSATTRVGRTQMRRPVDSRAAAAARGVSVDSPRMNSSGKIVFHSLERSSSSPSSFNGGPRFKHRGMERSYSANVRITPVLNVPVCSLRGSSKSGGVFGFPLFSAQQKRESSHGGANKCQQITGKARTDRS